ncbi:MAG: ubiquitin carboxyl-terminal hydrolase [archaeon]|nr:ubiquitin carboxyl-terminal hydrolase [archaeon]
MGNCLEKKDILSLSDGEEEYLFKGELFADIVGVGDSRLFRFSGIMRQESYRKILYEIKGETTIPADVQLDPKTQKLKWDIEMVNYSNRFKFKGKLQNEGIDLTKMNVDADAIISLTLTEKNYRSNNVPEIMYCEIVIKILYDRECELTGKKTSKTSFDQNTIIGCPMTVKKSLEGSGAYPLSAPGKKRIGRSKNKLNSSGYSNLSLTERTIFEPKKLPFTLIGLKNLGNTCYMNCTFQVLMHNKYFINSFSKKYKPDDSTKISFEFVDLLQNIEKRSKKTYSPATLVRLFKRMHKEYDDNGQHDCQDFFRIFLQDIHTEYNENKGKSKEEKKEEKKENESKLSKVEIFKKYKNNLESKEKSFLSEIFFGYQSYSFKCPCGNYEYSFNQFMDIPLYFNFTKENENKPFDLEQLISENFVDEQNIQSCDKCTKCKKKENLLKKTKICDLPMILTLSLQKTDAKNTQKKDVIVSFPLELDIQKIVDSDIIQSKIN